MTRPPLVSRLPCVLPAALFVLTVLLVSTRSFAATNGSRFAAHPSQGRPQGHRPEDGRQGGVGRAQAHRAEHGTGWATKTGATATEEVAYASNMTLRSEGNARYVTKHIYAGSERLASKMDARWFAEDNVQYYATDHLGSTNFTFDSEQNLISHTEYFPSGEVWRSETVATYQGLNPYSFTGKEWDATTGLYDLGARQYDPRLGQWLSPRSGAHRLRPGGRLKLPDFVDSPTGGYPPWSGP